MRRTPTRLLTLSAGVAGGALLLASPARSQCEIAELLAADAAASDRFGVAVAIDGDVAVVGADQDDDGASNAGSAYVFRRSGSTWTQEAKLLPSSPGSNYHFGQSVAVHGAVAVVGSPDDDDLATRAGSADVFRYNGASWVHEQELTASDFAASDRFGWSVAVDGATIAVGAKTDDDVAGDSGSVYVFRYNGSTWLQDQKLVASDAAGIAQFGDALAMDADLLVVGAWQDDDAGFFTGSAYVFRSNGTSYSEEQKLTASDAASFRWFGRSVDVEGDVVVAGAYGDGTGGSEAGAAYVFRFGGASWSQEAKLVASDAAADDRFGWSCGVSGSKAAIGSYADDDAGGDSGSVYVFSESGGSWTETTKLTASDGLAGDQFAYSLSMRGDDVLSGAHTHDHSVGDDGAAYVLSAGAACGTGTPLCFGDGSGTPCPCGNSGAGGEGCQNSTGVGALLSASGSTSVAMQGADPLVLHTSQARPDKNCVWLQGAGAPPASAFRDGILCVGNPTIRLPGFGCHPFPIQTLDPGGALSTDDATFGFDVLAVALCKGDDIASLAPTTRYYQTWFRDGMGPCGTGSNLTNGLQIDWTP